MNCKSTVRVTLKKDVLDQFTAKKCIKGTTIRVSPTIAKYLEEQGAWSPTPLDHLWEKFLFPGERP